MRPVCAPQAASSLALLVPELCYLMNLHQEFPELSIKAAAELMAAPMSCDSGTQTPTHFVEKFIDVNYNWNEWALRRCALPATPLRLLASQRCGGGPRRDGVPGLAG